jgi:hypothetical protein
MLLTSEPDVNDLIRYLMPSVVGAGINGVDMIGASTDGKLLDQSEAHVCFKAIGCTRGIGFGIDNQ